MKASGTPMENHTVDTADDVDPSGSDYKVDIAGLLFTPERDHLVQNNGQEVKADELKGKAIVLFIFPLDLKYLRPSVTLHLIEAYNELRPLGGVEFVLAPVLFDDPVEFGFLPEAIFNHLLSILPFPAVPFSDLEACGPGIVDTFLLHHHPRTTMFPSLPYWVIIDPNREVVANRGCAPHLFKLFGGAELHPLSRRRVWTLLDEHRDHRSQDRKRLIGQWDRLLASPDRDFLLASNGDKVPISSLQGKVVGLYFCENKPLPTHLKMIHKVYEDAKLRGLDLEIVQINFHYKFVTTQRVSTEYMSVQHCTEKTGWLTLPFKDPSCRKLQRILACDFYDPFDDDHEPSFGGDQLVIIDPRQTDANGPRFEFSGVEIFQSYGIEGYPFTRETLFETERRRHERHGILKLFPPGECHLTRPGSDDPVDASQLSGKRVLVLFAEQFEYESGGEFVSVLESKYRAQLEGDGIKFEVVYVSTDPFEPDFRECVKDMPWLVHPFDRDFARSCVHKAFGYAYWGIAAAAFGEDGELLAKQCGVQDAWRSEHSHKHEFPFVSDDTEFLIRWAVRDKCALDKYYCSSDDEEDDGEEES